MQYKRGSFTLVILLKKYSFLSLFLTKKVLQLQLLTYFLTKIYILLLIWREYGTKTKNKNL